jgi:hypothetical protein
MIRAIHLRAMMTTESRDALLRRAAAGTEVTLEDAQAALQAVGTLPALRHVATMLTA